MSDLSGLELRKAALEVLGWRYYRRDNSAHVFLKPNDADGYFVDNGLVATPFSEAPAEKLRGNAPAIESDPAVSEPMFLEWCAKNYYEWQMNICNPHDKFSEGHIAIWVHDHDDRVDVESGGATPSEARARVIVAAKVRV